MIYIPCLLVFTLIKARYTGAGRTFPQLSASVEALMQLLQKASLGIVSFSRLCRVKIAQLLADRDFVQRSESLKMTMVSFLIIIVMSVGGCNKTQFLLARVHTVEELQ